MIRHFWIVIFVICVHVRECFMSPWTIGALKFKIRKKITLIPFYLNSQHRTSTHNWTMTRYIIWNYKNQILKIAFVHGVGIVQLGTNAMGDNFFCPNICGFSNFKYIFQRNKFHKQLLRNVGDSRQRYLFSDRHNV